jgi:hypothetical protein
METHEAEVLEAKARGTFDEGVVSLTAESVTMSAGYPRVVHTDEQSGATTQLCRISIDRYVYFYLHTGNSTDVVFCFIHVYSTEPSGWCTTTASKRRGCTSVTAPR